MAECGAPPQVLVDLAVLHQRRMVVPERRPPRGQPRDPEVEWSVAVVPLLDERSRGRDRQHQPLAAVEATRIGHRRGGAVGGDGDDVGVVQRPDEMAVGAPLHDRTPALEVVTERVVERHVVLTEEEQVVVRSCFVDGSGKQPEPGVVDPLQLAGRRALVDHNGGGRAPVGLDEVVDGLGAHVGPFLAREHVRPHARNARRAPRPRRIPCRWVHRAGSRRRGGAPRRSDASP